LLRQSSGRTRSTPPKHNSTSSMRQCWGRCEYLTCNKTHVVFHLLIHDHLTESENSMCVSFDSRCTIVEQDSALWWISNCRRKWWRRGQAADNIQRE
jgi:hypothetical protein